MRTKKMWTGAALACGLEQALHWARARTGARATEATQRVLVEA